MAGTVTPFGTTQKSQTASSHAVAFIPVRVCVCVCFPSVPAPQIASQNDLEAGIPWGGMSVLLLELCTLKLLT